jgi:hypothetical protein
MKSIARRRFGIGTTDPDDCEIVIYGGANQPTDLHPLSTIRAVDEEIFAYLEKRKAKRRRDKCHQTRRGSINATLPS